MERLGTWAAIAQHFDCHWRCSMGELPQSCIDYRSTPPISQGSKMRNVYQHHNSVIPSSPPLSVVKSHGPAHRVTAREITGHGCKFFIVITRCFIDRQLHLTERDCHGVCCGFRSRSGSPINWRHRGFPADECTGLENRDVPT